MYFYVEILVIQFFFIGIIFLLLLGIFLPMMKNNLVKKNKRREVDVFMDGFLFCVISFLGGVAIDRWVIAWHENNNRNNENNHANDEYIRRDSFNGNDIDNPVIATEENQKITVEPETKSKIREQLFVHDDTKYHQMIRDLQENSEKMEERNKYFAKMIEQGRVNREKREKDVKEWQNRLNNSHKEVEEIAKDLDSGLKEFNKTVNDFSNVVNNSIDRIYYQNQ